MKSSNKEYLRIAVQRGECTQEFADSILKELEHTASTKVPHGYSLTKPGEHRERKLHRND